MQASTSRTGAAICRALTSPALLKHSLPPCTCRASQQRPLTSSVAATESESFRQYDSASRDETRHNPLSPSERQLRSSQSSAPKRTLPKSLQDEKRRTVYISGLAKTVTPADIKRFARRKLGLSSNEQSILEIVVLLSPSLSFNGQCIVQFDNPNLAARFIDHTRRRTGPGDSSSILHTQLVDHTRYPFVDFLLDRHPLTLHQPHLANASEERRASSLRLGATNEWSGKAVRLIGFPRDVSVLHILDQAKVDNFEIVRAPGLLQEKGKLEDVVFIPPAAHIGKDRSWAMYLVRLPSISEAHRMVRLWNATWPTWGGMQGDWRIKAEVVW